MKNTNIAQFEAAMKKKGATGIDVGKGAIMVSFPSEEDARACHKEMNASSVVQNPFGDKPWHVIFNLK